MEQDATCEIGKPIHERAEDWTLRDVDGYDYNDIHDRIEYVAKKSFDEYHPTIGPYPPFMNRLCKWLDSASDENDQKILFRLVPELLFLGSGEFISLYRTAFNEIVLHWLVDIAEIDFNNPDFNNTLNAYSARFRPPIPGEAGHPFRLIPAADSGESRPPIPEHSGHPLY